MVYSRIKTQITDFMGEVFEKLCIEYMWSIYTQLPFTVQNINRWWGNNPDLKSQTELDFIAYGNDGELAIFGECKWRNEELGMDVIEGLIKKCGMFCQFKQKHYFYFSKSGFTHNARAFANGRDDIRLVSFHEMFDETYF